MTTEDWARVLSLVVAAIFGSGVTLAVQALNRWLEQRKGHTTMVWMKYRVGFLVYLAILGTAYTAYQVTNEAAENGRVRAILVCQADLNQQFIQDALARSQVAGQDRTAVDSVIKAIDEDLARQGGPDIAELRSDIQDYLKQRADNDQSRPSYNITQSCSLKGG